MAKLPILTFPTQSLKKPSVNVETVSSKITDFVQDMFETMYEADGIGLAAPQVGENLNILVIDVPEDREAPSLDPTLAKGPLCLINPRIVSSSGKIQYEEGCLSCPELLVKVDRHQSIIVESLDAEGRLQQHHLQDLMAVCFQHEQDHLKGKLLTDYISSLKRDMYRKKRVRLREDDSDISKI